MATLDPQTSDVASVEPTEVFSGDLTEYVFDNPDPDENWKYKFYELGERDKNYTLMSVLEYLFNNKHSVRITVEDLGESPAVAAAKARAAEFERQRQEALHKLAVDAVDRQQHMVKYTSR
jgi:hypothetical protein